MKQVLSRQSFLGGNSDEVLASSRVALVGLGGGGSHLAQQLAHVGVGNFALVDGDRAEETNLNRLVGATLKDALTGLRKTRIAYRLIKGINPDARVWIADCNWQEAHTILHDRDVVFGCLDSYRDRDELETLCRRYLIPYIDIGMDVTSSSDQFVVSGQMILSMPGEPCMKCFGFITEALLAREAERYGAAGPRPQVVWPNGVLASAAVGTFIQLTTPWHKNHKPISYLEYDKYQHTAGFQPVSGGGGKVLQSLFDKRLG